MSADPTERSSRCPRCGAERDAGSPRCWLCLAEFDGGGAASAPRSWEQSPADRPTRVPPGGASFGLSTLLLLATLATALAGLLAAAPGLGIFAALLLAPAVFRTASLARRREAQGERVTATEKAAVALTSLFVASLCLAAAIGALFCCFCGTLLFAAASLDTQGGQERGALMAGGACVGMTGLFIGFALLSFIGPRVRRRYRRELGLENAAEPPS